MTCPSDQEALVAGFGQIDWAASNVHNFSYSWNASFFAGDRDHALLPQLWPGYPSPTLDGHAVTRLAMIPHPAYKVILFEEAHPNDGLCFLGWPSNGADDTPCIRHSLRANYGFADGHVDAYGPEEVGYTKAYSPGDFSTQLQDPVSASLRGRLFHLLSDAPN